MKSYRGFAIICFVAGHPAALLFWMGGHPLAAFAVLTVANLAVWIPTVIPNRQWFGHTVTSFATPREEVWLTIDDGPDRDDTGEILALLERFDAKATFFVIGERASRCPDAVRALRDAGHEVGNHTQRHRAASFWMLPRGILRSEVRSCGETLGEILGERTPTLLFRPPVGMKNPLLQGILDREGLVHIGWSARGYDGVPANPENVLRRIRSRLCPGAIILLHQGRRDRSGRLLAPIVLEGLLCELEQRGMRCVIPPREAYRPSGRRKTTR